MEVYVSIAAGLALMGWNSLITWRMRAQESDKKTLISRLEHFVDSHHALALEVAKDYVSHKALGDLKKEIFARFDRLETLYVNGRKNAQ